LVTHHIRYIVQQHNSLTSPLPHTLPSFFFNDPTTPEIYTLSLHDALPIYLGGTVQVIPHITNEIKERIGRVARDGDPDVVIVEVDRKSTRLNSSHSQISYAVFCLKKKKKTKLTMISTYCHKIDTTTYYNLN